MDARTLTRGTAVRLSFDTGPATVGHILDVIDKVRIRVEMPSDDGTEAHGEYHDGRVTPLVLPVTILVPVCEWVEEYADDYGLACSEPGVPTWVSIPCHHDATTVVTVNGGEYPPYDLNLCDEHRDEARRQDDGVTVAALNA